MSISLKEIIDSYDPEAPLEEASTIPASWYVNDDVYEAEQQTVFSNSWQVVGRVDQVRGPGEFITREVAGEPLLIVRGEDKTLRGFYNVCRHHAAGSGGSYSGRRKGREPSVPVSWLDIFARGRPEGSPGHGRDLQL